MKKFVLSFAAVLSIAAPAFGSPNGKIFATYEEANAACSREAFRLNRDYMVSAYYDWGFEFKGWICQLGNINGGN